MISFIKYSMQISGRVVMPVFIKVQTLHGILYLLEAMENV